MVSPRMRCATRDVSVRGSGVAPGSQTSRTSAAAQHSYPAGSRETVHGSGCSERGRQRGDSGCARAHASQGADQCRNGGIAGRAGLLFYGLSCGSSDQSRRAVATPSGKRSPYARGDDLRRYCGGNSLRSSLDATVRTSNSKGLDQVAARRDASIEGDRGVAYRSLARSGAAEPDDSTRVRCFRAGCSYALVDVPRLGCRPRAMDRIRELHSRVDDRDPRADPTWSGDV
jgi:hypothetical protein